MSFEFILYEVENGRARITLNRPEKRNAMNGALLEELNTALWEADNDTRVHCVIVKGAGSCFSSGYDLGSDLGSNQPYWPSEVGMKSSVKMYDGLVFILKINLKI